MICLAIFRALTPDRLISLKSLRNVVLSAKERRRCSPTQNHILVADAHHRAKRYERLMKANGINPNGGPDPKSPPPCTPKASKSKIKDHPAKPRAKKRKLDDNAEKKLEESFTVQRPRPEPCEDLQLKEGSFATPSGLPESTSHDSLYEPTRTQIQNEETSFDFDEFCSPEMFAHCTLENTSTSQWNHGHGSLPTSASCPEPAAFVKIQAISPMGQEDSKLEKKSGRETVIIPD